MTDVDFEARLAVFLDYENLAIGARDHLGAPFDYGVVADALAERGRVIARKAYADWSGFDNDRRKLTRHHVELVDIPQRMGGSRKNAADIKLAVDAVELALEREYITTFVLCSGDSDLSPLVHKLRELDRTVIGVGVRDSTSKLLPPACDEFLFYDNLVGDDPSADEAAAGDDSGAAPAPGADRASEAAALALATLAGMESASGSVRASMLKRAIRRKDPTFNESEIGFRGFRAFLEGLAGDGLVALDGASDDPHVSLAGTSAQARAERLLLEVLADGPVRETSLKTALCKHDPAFSERKLGYRRFKDFVGAAAARGIVNVAGTENNRLVSRP